VCRKDLGFCRFAEIAHCYGHNQTMNGLGCTEFLQFETDFDAEGDEALAHALQLGM